MNRIDRVMGALSLASLLVVSFVFVKQSLIRNKYEHETHLQTGEIAPTITYKPQEIEGVECPDNYRMAPPSQRQSESVKMPDANMLTDFKSREWVEYHNSEYKMYVCVPDGWPNK